VRRRQFDTKERAQVLDLELDEIVKGIEKRRKNDDNFSR
jgi:hypothetical protein